MHTYGWDSINAKWYNMQLMYLLVCFLVFRSIQNSNQQLIPVLSTHLSSLPRMSGLPENLAFLMSVTRS